MKYAVVTTQTFRKSLKRLKKSGRFKDAELQTVLDFLVNGRKLSKQYRDLHLTGELREFRECHIRADLLLVYKIEKEELVLVLVRIGSHSKVL